jgi:hypothetical protein
MHCVAVVEIPKPQCVGLIAFDGWDCCKRERKEKI